MIYIAGPLASYALVVRNLPLPRQTHNHMYGFIISSTVYCHCHFLIPYVPGFL